MPFYHFHVHSQADIVRDADGRELADLDIARREAIKGIRSLLAADVLQGRLDLRGRIEVSDAEGGIFLTVPFAQALDVYLE